MLLPIGFGSRYLLLVAEDFLQLLLFAAQLLLEQVTPVMSQCFLQR